MEVGPSAATIRENDLAAIGGEIRGDHVSDPAGDLEDGALAEHQHIDVECAVAVGGEQQRITLRAEAGIIIVGELVRRKLLQVASVGINHAELVVISARAGEDDAPAMLGGGPGCGCEGGRRSEI